MVEKKRESRKRRKEPWREMTEEEREDAVKTILSDAERESRYRDNPSYIV